MKFEALAKVYAMAIKAGDRTIDEVPAFLREQVTQTLKEETQNEVH
ncbi:CD1375 family protein [Lacticaseibacillus absianus]|nr:CD1375 family protein [Lacticaseibacillus absianus]